jgi:hypothetical protein
MEEENNKEKKFLYATTPEGKIKMLDSFSCQAENRIISLCHLEDESIIITIDRFEESEEQPYTKKVVSQHLRFKKIALLMACLNKANIDFGINADKIIEDLNNKKQE